MRAEAHTAGKSRRERVTAPAAQPAEVVAWFLSSGKTIVEVASALNLPESTVRTWLEQAAAAASGETPRERGTGEAVKSLDESGFIETADFIPEIAEPEFVHEMAFWPERTHPEPLVRPDLAAVRAEAVKAIAQAEAKAARSARAMARAEKKAAEAETRAKAAIEAAAGARQETAAAYAAAVEAMLRAEISAAEKVAAAEAAAAEAVARAEARARQAEVAAEEALVLYETALAEGQAVAEKEAVAQGGPVVGTQAPEALAKASPAPDEVSRTGPPRLWVHATGRTLTEATQTVLDQLGVNEDSAEIEVLAHSSRWLPGGVHIRARVRVGRPAYS
jgi:hypothetical protein